MSLSMTRPAAASDDRDAASLFDDLIARASERALAEDEASAAMELMADGAVASDRIRALLETPALSVEEVDAATLAGLVKAVRARALRPQGITRAPLLDTCGTGGGASTFNISTAAALIVAAAAGVHAVAKHGNRAVASASGSADALERLGIPIDLDPASAAASINEHRFAFLFAPKFHTAFAHVAPVRKELAAEGKRTAFNFVGPLANPAFVSRQLIGIFRPEKIRVIADVMARIGLEDGFCVAGRTESGDPVDEISIAGETAIVRVGEGAIVEERFHPRDAGIEPAPLETLRARDAAESAAIIRAIVVGEAKNAAAERAVVVNAAACFRLLGERDWSAAAARAVETIRSGAVARLIDRLAAQGARA